MLRQLAIVKQSGIKLKTIGFYIELLLLSENGIVEIENSELQKICNISLMEIKRQKDALVSRGLIDYTKGNKHNKKAIYNLYFSTDSSLSKEEVHAEVEHVEPVQEIKIQYEEESYGEYL